MTSRRHFLAQAPLGLIGTALALDTGTDSSASSGRGEASRPAPLPFDVNGAPELRWIPKHEELCYTFGGVAPKQRVQPGTRIIT